VPFEQAINFRAGPVYVTDGANESAETATTVNYPRTTAQGNTVGYETISGSLSTRDRSNTIDRRLAGLAFISANGTFTYRIDLPGPGTYRISGAANETVGGGLADTRLEIYDDATLLVAAWDQAAFGANPLVGINNEVYTGTVAVRTAAWVAAGPTYRDLTFSSSIARFKIVPPTGGADNRSFISHLFIEQLASPPASYTLTAEPGAFVLTGQPVALRAGRRLALAAGTFALSGQAVALLAGRRLALAAGGFALAGQPVALRAARRLPLADGAFTLAGQPVALLAGRRLVLAPGSFALVGQPVTLSYSENLVHRTLVAEPGNFALIGQDVRLLAGRRIAAAAGTFSLSGQPVALRAARRLHLGAGALALTGQPVALLAGRRMTISLGTLALAGQPVQLLAGRRLSLDAGAFTLTGQPVTLAWSGAAPIFVPASRTIRLPPRPRVATLAARDRTITLPPRPRIVVLPPERT